MAIHYVDPDGNQKDYPRLTDQLPPEPKEIKPHPYGVELGRLVSMLERHEGADDRAVLESFVFARQPQGGAEVVHGGQDQHPRQPEEDRPA